MIFICCAIVNPDTRSVLLGAHDTTEALTCFLTANKPVSDRKPVFEFSRQADVALSLILRDDAVRA